MARNAPGLTVDPRRGGDTGILHTVGEAVRWGREVLQPSQSASLDAQLLLAHVLGVSRARVIASPDQPLREEEQAEFSRLLRRREAGEPVAFLRGHVEWLGMEMEVTPDVLIPRPETELVAERAIEVARERQSTVVADIGTGSGAIAAALAVALPEARVYAVDVSEDALAVAARNLRHLGVAERVTLLPGRLLEPLAVAPDLIVANLPYLSDEMMASLPQDVRSEPSLALHGGRTGLEPYRDLLGQMEQRGWRVPALLEIDPRQADEMRSLVKALFPESSVDIGRDYTGHERIVFIEP